MKTRWIAAATAAVLVLGMHIPASSATSANTPIGVRDHRSKPGPRSFTPAVAAMHRLSRYFVVMRTPSVVDQESAARASGTRLPSTTQQSVYRTAEASQAPAIGEARAMGGQVVYRYGALINGFSAQLTPSAAEALAHRPDVAKVEPVGIVTLANSTSVPFIGATKVWHRLGVKGQGMTVADVDTGIDYTHKDFGGPGTLKAYRRNDPRYIEPGTFPTKKVIGGYDLVGDNYDVLDDDPSNDIPRPDPDPLDFDGHGTHTAGTCCGNGVPGKVGPGVAPKSKIYSFKVWDEGNSTDDVLVAGYERAVDPNQDGSTRDHVDVLTFSGGVDYGTQSSTEARAAEQVVKTGTVFVAAAGNDGNQAAGGSAYDLGTPAAAPDVIAVGASVDEFDAQTITVKKPAGITNFPDHGVIVHQGWSAPMPWALTDDVIDARAVDPPADPQGTPAASDQQLCSPVSGQPFAGKIALVFKGPASDGDCLADDKVLNAQNAGAVAVLLWSGFAGPASQFSPGNSFSQVTIPAFAISTADGGLLADAVSPNAPSSYNSQNLNVTFNKKRTAIPGYPDRIVDFSSEGPARVTNLMKPDIVAPGFDITSAGAGTGTGSLTESGTSMATPHVSGVAVLLRQIHPKWSPNAIKALLMNQAKRRGIKDINGAGPVPATVQGAGRVQAAQSAFADSLASPGSLSFGLRRVPHGITLTHRFVIRNLSHGRRHYVVTAHDRYSDYPSAVASAQLMFPESEFTGSRASFSLRPEHRQKMKVQLTVDPSAIGVNGQLFSWYAFLGNTDGLIQIKETGGKHGDSFGVPWHVVPGTASDDSVTSHELDVAMGANSFGITNAGEGTSEADIYQLGAVADNDGSHNEEDLTAIGARSFTGSSIDGSASGLPSGTDHLLGLSWPDFVSNVDPITEPIEFGASTYSLHNTTETMEVDVAIDSGADGVFADPTLKADYLLVKTPLSGDVCFYDLSQASPFDQCAKTYSQDYAYYNSAVIGLPVNATDVGLSNSRHTLAYSMTACTGRFSGDVPAQFCDTLGQIDPATGTYDAKLNVTNPALVTSVLTCGGFFGGADCSGAHSVTVTRGSATAGDRSALLVLFPNNSPRHSHAIVATK
ncbi:MAG: S8 family serine peptidase [Actinomycetota bacterium]